jgi:hypothetical protein
MQVKAISRCPALPEAENVNFLSSGEPADRTERFMMGQTGGSPPGKDSDRGSIAASINRIPDFLRHAFKCGAAVLQQEACRTPI